MRTKYTLTQANEHDPSKPITTSKREKGTNRYKNAHIQAVAVKFSRRREQKTSALERLLD